MTKKKKKAADLHLEGIVAKRKRCSIVGYVGSRRLTTVNRQRNELTIEREDGCWVAPLYGLGLFGEESSKAAACRVGRQGCSGTSWNGRFIELRIGLTTDNRQQTTGSCFFRELEEFYEVAVFFAHGVFTHGGHVVVDIG